MNHYILNGTVLPNQEFTITTNNRAFSYGDGLFETIVVKNGLVLYLNDHFKRISEGLSILAIHSPFKKGADEFASIVYEVLANHTIKDARVKLQVWRKQGGYVTPESYDADYLIAITELKPAIPIKEKALVSEQIKLTPSVLSPYKTLNFLPYILAGIEKKKRNCDEIILTNTDGYVAEASSSNLFWTKDNTLYTPSTDTGCIHGIMRKQILNFCKQEGIVIREGFFLAKELETADSIFTSNVTGLSLIEKLNDTEIKIQYTLYQSIRLGLDLL
jgi:4-amino-4-deoxychorismate lyase